MKATYNAVCPVCRGRIVKGDELGRTDNRWAHRNCADSNERQKAGQHRLWR